MFSYSHATKNHRRGHCGNSKPSFLSRLGPAINPIVAEPLERRILLSAIFTVSNLNDSGAGSLRQAISDAEAGPFNGNAFIVFPPGLTGTIDLASGLPVLSGNITIDGPGASLLTLNGQRHPNSVFTIFNGVTAAIENLTITGGIGNSGYGGGIENGGTLTVTGCTIGGNTAQYGGGIENHGGTLTITNSTITGNSAIEGGGVYTFGTLTVTNSTVGANLGGGIFNYGSLTVIGSSVGGNSGSGLADGEHYGTLAVTESNISGNSGAGIGGVGVITDCTISGNSGGGIIGGGTITDCTISGNYGRMGGGIEGGFTVTGSTIMGNSALSGGGVYGLATLIITSSTISGNISGSGGGIFGGVSTAITNSTISGNSASRGGGVYSDGTLTVSSSTINGNLAVSGGGISSGTTTTITNSTIDENSCSIDGGAISNRNRGTLTIVNSTISGNSAPSGGGIYSYYGKLSITNSTISGNAAALLGSGIYLYSAECLLDGAIVAVNQGRDIVEQSDAVLAGSNDLIGDGSDEGVLTNSLRGTPANPLNPMLAPLGNYGGPTQTMPLIPGSPAIGAGAAFNNLATDQRGFPRPTTSGIDIGADQGALFAGDTNFDGTVNLTDLLTLLNNYGQTGKNWTQGDFNFDGTVNLNDLLALLNNYGLSANDASVATPAVALVSYRAKTTPFASEPLTWSTSSLLDADGNILQTDGRALL